MELSEFLLARIAEDEAVAKEWPDYLGPVPDGYPFWVDPQGHPIYQPRTRVLAECQAKRSIVEFFATETQWRVTERPGVYGWQTVPVPVSELDDGDGWAVLTRLALPYADHSDYDATWRLA